MKPLLVGCLFVGLWFPALALPTRWVASDSLGEVLPGARSLASPGEGWFLAVEVNGAQERRTLVFEGKTQKVFLLDFDAGGSLLRQQVFQNNLPVQDTGYVSGDARPQQETLFAGGVPSVVYRYQYAVDGLSSRLAEDAEGTFLFRDTLYRYPDGRLRRLERDGPEGPLAEISWSYGANGLEQVWVADEELKADGRHKVLSYRDNETREEVLRGTELLVSRVTSALADGFSFERETASEGETAERTKDSRGRLVRQTTTFTDGSQQVTRYEWDEQDRLVHEETDIRGGLETTDYLQGDDTVVAEKRRYDRLIQRETRQGGEKVLVELFDDGAKFLEETWEDGRKVSERYFDGERLIRERKL